MKNQSNLKDSVLEAMLNQSNQQILDEVKINAQSFGQRNLPLPSRDNMDVYFEEHHYQSQQLIDKVNAELQCESTCHQVMIGEKSAQEKIMGIRNHSDELKRDDIKVKSKISSLPQSSLRKIILVLAILMGISLFEGVLAVPVFEAWGYNLIESIIAGLIFGAIIAAFAHVAKRIIELGKTLSQKVIIAFSILLFMTVLFTYFAKARAEYLSNNAVDSTNNHLIEFSPIPFVLISVLLFIVAVSLCIFYLPSKAERKAMEEKASLLKQQNAISKELESKKTQIDNINQELIALKERCGAILVKGCMLEELIINNAKAGFSLWKRQNLMYRQDNLKPDCFNDQYPFLFTTYFHSIKSLGNENNNK